MGLVPQNCKHYEKIVPVNVSALHEAATVFGTAKNFSLSLVVPVEEALLIGLRPLPPTLPRIKDGGVSEEFSPTLLKALCLTLGISSCS